MSAAVPIKKPPRRPQRPVERLDSIKNPQPRPPPGPIRTQSQECPNPDCNAKKGVEEDGKIICSACGSVIDELTMVTEVTYGLATGGQHIVRGYHVSADQAFAKRGAVVDKTRAATSQEQTAQFGESVTRTCQTIPAKVLLRPQSHCQNRYITANERPDQRPRHADLQVGHWPLRFHSRS